MPVSVALSMLTPASLIKERPLPPHSRLFEVSHFHVRDEHSKYLAESDTNLPAYNFDFSFNKSLGRSVLPNVVSLGRAKVGFLRSQYGRLACGH